MKTVDDYVKGIEDPKLRALVKRVRSVVKSSIPEAVESVKHGIPNYSINGQSVAAIAEYSKHVNLYFFCGAKLASNLLEGNGKGMRHISIQSGTDIKERSFSSLLKQAAKLTTLINLS